MNKFRLKPEMETASEGNSDSSSLYQPKKSWGWMSLMILTLICLALAWLAWSAYQLTADLGALVSVIVFSILAILSMFLFISYFNIKYELTSYVLRVYFGPFQYEIPFNEITSVEQKSLTPGFGIGVILPGFAKFVVNYRHEGKLFMCSTRALKDVVVIKSNLSNLGISPEHDQIFVKELREKMQFTSLFESE